jgi:phenylalanyl-tRNA synthetase beta chain
MNISHNWLKEYLRTDLEPKAIAAILTDLGLEVEHLQQVETIKGGLKGVVVAEVLACDQHPNADRLKVTKVDTGNEIHQVVCGAPNVAKGQKVLLATVGTTLYPQLGDPLKIKLSKIREVESAGMLCAEDELGLGESHAGIMVLPNEVNIGTPAAELFQIESDWVYEIGLTPNRSDALGHIGVARDLAAYLSVHSENPVTVQWPSVEGFKVENNSLPISIQIENKELCPRYCGLTISGVEIKDSPNWLKNRLRNVGLHPLNNVVDVTNYVMRELGTPLHAFDVSALNGQILVRTAKAGETLVTLDGTERKLSPENLLITNGTDPLCIAGVFGGAHSGVSEHTTDIFLESALFDGRSIRKTAREHGLHTDASFRFERGVDPELTRFALERAATLIIEVAGGKVSMDVSDQSVLETTGSSIELSLEKCRSITGVYFKHEEIVRILNALDIRILDQQEASWKIHVPAYRSDVTREIDVIEDILRVYGYNNVPLPEKLHTVIPSTGNSDENEYAKRVATEFLIGRGFVEIMNNSLTSAKHEELQTMDGEESKAVKVLNPLSLELNTMRTTLLFGALETVAHNQNRQHPDLKLMEFGSCYQLSENGYHEEQRLMLVVTGRQESESWMTGNEKHSFYSLKLELNALMERFGLFSHVKEGALEEMVSLLADGVTLKLRNNHLASMGWVKQQVLQYFGIKQPVFTVEINWDLWMKSQEMNRIRFTELPKTFEVRRDFSLLLDNKNSFSEIERIAKSCEKKILKKVGLFDVYEGKNLPDGKKSYAVSFTFQDKEHTLKDELIDPVMQRIREKLESELGATLR